MSFGPTASHIQLGYIMWTDCQMRLEKITEAIDLVVQYNGHKSWSKFYVSSVGHKAIILGHTWLAENNPDINWHTGEVKFDTLPRLLRTSQK